MLEVVERSNSSFVSVVIVCDGYWCGCAMRFIADRNILGDGEAAARKFDLVRRFAAEESGWTVWPDAGEFCSWCSLRFN